jgi:hypothetical protein
MIEADFINVVQNRSKTPFDIWINSKLRRQYRPKLAMGDIPIDYYFPRDATQVPEHSRGWLVANGKQIAELVIKESPDALRNLSGQEMRVVLDVDLRPAVVASVLKAAHLSMFHLLGYRHVFSAGGLHLADTLKDFFLASRGRAKKDVVKDLETAFMPLSRLISPMLIKDASILNGTVFDNRVIGCIGGSQGLFAIGVIVPAAGDRFCVFLPSGCGHTIDTYLGFLNDPPPFFHAKVFEYCPSDGANAAYWKTSKDDPIRIPMPEKLPES